MIISLPMNTPLYSVRMRASGSGQHLTGAERIVPEAAVSEVTAALTARAMRSANVGLEEIHCRVEKIDPVSVLYKRLPDVSTYQVDDWQQGRHAAISLLSDVGVLKDVASRAVELLANGAGTEGRVMRGAVIMDAKSGERLEADQARGVRVSRMDLSPEYRPALEAELVSNGLDHHRVLEALVLAGKVLSAPGMVAELCWSDAPNYTTGYVADPQGGYQRISDMKLPGDSRGGRVFFVDLSKTTLDGLADYLQRQVVLFNSSGSISSPEKWMSVDE
jgi:6-carboxyhexanoate--CoA ligase